ncbi:thioredoxin [Candidatus Mycoplasma haematolamae str. Purdue]|uniref:Thioredoxin n=1 Tax=Mycoplasma haematolamae (strain Purdue) TaxID=1212765 RepID=I7BKG3_MYCHA|nr:thioredoxin family protein [Candidatus Mycoplasma haematolamae]AFO52378.1 thioredoxin [Candidatus Mycoplasma haematolamae str. Purdue]
MTSIERQEEFQSHLDSGKDLIIDFYADWCPPCRQLMPVLESVSLEEKFKNIEFIKVNVSSFPELSKRYEISSIPSLIFIKGNRTKEAEKHTGFQDKDTLILKIDRYFF